MCSVEWALVKCFRGKVIVDMNYGLSRYEF